MIRKFVMAKAFDAAWTDMELTDNNLSMAERNNMKKAIEAIDSSLKRGAK